MSQDKNYEVQVREEGQWTIHETFPGDQNEEALEEAAMQLEELNKADSVRIIVEQYDPDTGVFNDQVVFKRDKEKQVVVVKAKIRRGVSRPRTAGKPRKGGARPGARIGKTRPATLSSVLGRLLLVVLFSLGLAGLISFGVSELLAGKKLFGTRISGNTQTNLLTGIFILTFMISALGMTMKVMKGVQLQSSGHNRFVMVLLGLWSRMASKSHARQAISKDAGKFAAIKRAQAAARAAAEAALQPSAETLEKAEEEAAPEEPQEEPKAEEEETAEKAEQEDPDALSSTAEKLKNYMMVFLGNSLKGSKIDAAKMDNFNKFGISIYLAGACEILTQEGKMDENSCSKILSECVQILGFKKSHAVSFSQKYEEYLMADSRYMQMFQTGRNAINTYLTDEAAGPGLLDVAIEQWNQPKPKELQSGPVTVLFTDIVGSTAMTQALGDEGAQQMVRVHNRIVREALSRNAGREVKHTGDGIMASFAKTTDGVQGSIQMQTETALHNQQNPDLPLHLKIGLNAGEPIAEDNDLFGTVVQLSARIVDKASADQIFVSETVRGLCAGKDFQFQNLGGFEMKGFHDQITLYEVVWNGGGAGAETPAPAPAPAQPEGAAPAGETPPAETAPQEGTPAPEGQPAPAQPAPAQSEGAAPAGEAQTAPAQSEGAAPAGEAPPAETAPQEGTPAPEGQPAQPAELPAQETPQDPATAQPPKTETP